MLFDHVFASYRKYGPAAIKVRVQESESSRPRLSGLVWYVHLDVRTALWQHNLDVRMAETEKVVS